MIANESKSMEVTFVEQEQGTVMGNNLSPFLTDVFMSKFKRFLKIKLFWIPLNVEYFSLNNKFDSIKFTQAIQSNNKLPFLDILAIKLDNIL